MDRNKIKKYLKENFISEKYVKGFKYNIRNTNNVDDKGGNYTYVDDLEGGRFKSDDGHYFTLDGAGSNWKISQLNEEKKPVGLKNTEKVQKDSKKHNKEYQSDVKSKMTDYENSVTGEKENSEAVKKHENSKKAQDFHDDYETLNGLEMNRYDNTPSDEFKERALKAIEGDPSMGNGPGANAEATWGASSDTFGKDLVKRIKARDKKEVDSVNTMVQFGDDIELADDKPRLAKRKTAVSENKEEKKETKMKRLNFKKPFNGVGNALQLIPENYKVDNKVFQMTDGNENYEIRWEGSVNEGKAIVLTASDKKLVNEDMQHMKHLMNYNSKEALGTVKGNARLDENSKFADIFNKTKQLINEMNEGKDVINENAVGVAGMGFVAETEEVAEEIAEGENIEGQTAPEVKDDNVPHAKAEGDMVMNEEEVNEECDDVNEECGEDKDRFDEVFES